jgi:hypothetical protein
MEPAKSIVAMLGGPKKIAILLKLSTGAITKWYLSTEKGGCGGLIPSRHIVSLCKFAASKRKFLEPNMFFEGHV